MSMRMVCRLILFIVLCMASVTNALAQEVVFVIYEGTSFSVRVPRSLPITHQTEDRVVFSSEDLSIEISLLLQSDATKDAFLKLGEGNANQIVPVLETLLYGSDYQVDDCSDLAHHPCVKFMEILPSGSVFMRAAFFGPSGLQVYAITFRAPSESSLEGLQPDAVLSTFRFTGSAVQPAASATPTPAKEQLFNVVVNGNVNVRSCGSTTCSIVGQATDGQVLAVLGQDDEWYEVQWGTGTAFIASWLTTRGPDVVVDLSEGYIDLTTMCTLFLRTSRGESDLNLAISGDRKDEVWVDIYRPGDATPLDVNAQYDKTFIDTGDTYIYQTYYWSTYWPRGLYRIELRYQGKSSLIGFEIKESGDHLLYVDCD